MKQSNIEKFNPTDLHKFLMQSARDNFEENRSDFNAGMAMMMGLVKKYFCNDFDIAIRDNNGWNSVDEELPIDEGLVLLLKDDGDIVIGQYVFDLSPFLASTEFYQNQDNDWIADLDDVTHWQPLPKSPKELKDE